ncbi:hypothetical protein CWE14_00950 [Aliidiomarina soli]|uniref:Type II secretion system protein GspF domain-containing protein n=2 Tax=Aliidiomarina soli TaxID=1928574 RepID=A0A432WLB1_9GAMM|nr:hypothetical protein CWE14_00950 [Aliidiomarina soli]
MTNTLMWIKWLLNGLCFIAAGSLTIAIVEGARQLIARVRWRRRSQQFLQQLPDALVLIKAGLESGNALLANLQMVQKESTAPLQDEIAMLLAQLRLGHSIDECMQDWLKRMPLADLERVVVALKLAQQHGGQQARVLRQLADSMQAKQILQRRVAALASQGKMQAKVMTGLPILMLLALAALETPTMLALSRHPLGWLSFAVLMLMLSTGYWLIRKLTRLQVIL